MNKFIFLKKPYFQHSFMLQKYPVPSGRGSLLKVRNIPEEFIAAYVATNIPYSRAGGFGIQDIGARIIESIDGDYFNAIGLPLYNLLERLYKINPDIVLDSM